MNDRATSFLRLCLARAGSLGLMSLAGNVRAAEKPNIVMIRADDLGCLDLGSYDAD